MNIAIIRLAEEIPFGKWGPGTGIINQCHDSLIVECPESEGPRVAKLLEDCMNFTHPGLPGVTFTAEAAIGHAWTDV
jgi:DNA polymerase I-like protein with 3'-5' exonuclease and polymerase domains